MKAVLINRYGHNNVVEIKDLVAAKKEESMKVLVLLGSDVPNIMP